MYLLPVVELRNRSINSWLTLVPPGAAMIFIAYRRHAAIRAVTSVFNVHFMSSILPNCVKTL